MSNNHFNEHQTRGSLAEITVREATVGDRRALDRLAALDSSRPPAEPVLVAEVGGELRAAISMLDGRAIADPFHPTSELVAMLRLRIGQAVGSGSAVRGLGRLRLARPGPPTPSAPSVPGIPAVPGRAA